MEHNGVDAYDLYYYILPSLDKINIKDIFKFIEEYLFVAVDIYMDILPLLDYRDIKYILRLLKQKVLLSDLARHIICRSKVRPY